MRWTPGGDRSNVEDRRGQGGGFGGFGGGGMRMGLGGTIIMLILGLIFGRNFISSDSGGDVAPPGQAAPGANGGAPVQESAAEANLREFVTFVLNDAQDTWKRILPQTENAQYHDAKLVLFRDATQTGCGVGQSAMGPFYCPLDERVYIDLGFYEELRQRFGANGDFAQAYVITHEIGHHVQHILGIDQQVREAQRRYPNEVNALSVKLELQADCFAGVWGNSTGQRGILEKGDVEEGLNAAAAIGDDRIQRETQGSVHPESFTHGTSAQRQYWFKHGLQTGDPKSCDTFNQRGP